MKQTIRIVRPLRGDQITIPARFRRQLGIDEHTLLQMELVGKELTIRPVEVSDRAAGSGWARDLYELFAPVREKASRFTSRQINADIDKAVVAVRSERAKGAPSDHSSR